MYHSVLATALLNRPQMEKKESNRSIIKWHNRDLSNEEEHTAPYHVKF
jgi:hypothetical protein